ncbi:hypothetical protein AS159_01580 [Thermotoga sp. Ku-13t]|uniref:YkgJ family cysteine cluster protein n=1 Tax=Thermotoga sp. Ku-13t TaxID=1755813 RepID=UPI0013EB8BD3|nr:YkgJ family cysteine cluster protein [Thermotoga sp. Ku-13t]KAF2958418.1 hypothetical protein AS159_01580 [Thermotoga sp. Ku-13t]
MLQRLAFISSQVLSIYEELELLHEKLHIGCNGCRRCCETAAYNIEVTILEFVPLALHLIETNQFDFWFEKVQHLTPADRCALLVDESIKAEGGCLFHSYRPLMCRLFSASYLKRKNIEILSCSFLKESLSQKLDQLVDAQHYFDRLYDIDFYLATTKYDINTAFRKALEYVGMRALPTGYPSIPIAS